MAGKKENPVITGDMKNNVDRASILIESLPYIRKMRGQTFVIKYGGNAMINEELKQSVMDDITLLKYIGINPVIVHGGGPDISDMLTKVNKESHFVNGLRYTDDETMGYAQMVLIGKTNKDIVSTLCGKGAKAIGISGIDGNLIEAEKMTEDVEGNPIDIGYVGKIKKINTKVISMLANDEYIPVIAPIGVGKNGESYNINADTVAAEVAVALKASKLITLTDVGGVLRKLEDGTDYIIPVLDENDVKDLVNEGIISGGMIPKIEGCLDTVLRGVDRAHIIDGRIPHSIILETFTKNGIGTMIVKEKKSIMSIENDFTLIRDYDYNYCLQVFNLLPVAFVKGRGCYLYDTEGRKYLDMIGGIAVNCLGYNHPKLTSAITSQAKNLIHACNYYYIPQKSELAYRLCRASFADKVFFCNSGAEANEAAIKLARSYYYYKDIKKYEIITADMSFHGRTMGTIAATGQEKFSRPFAPNVPGFVHVPYNDIDAMIKAVNPYTAAIMLELIQGESGVHPADLEYIQAVKKLCVEKKILLIFDEVQTGVGRTGKMFCYQNYGVTPDIMTLAKGLGGGVPIGAMLTTNEVATGFRPGDHGSTFGGNPLACAAGNAVMEVFEDENIIDNVKDVSDDLFEKLNKMRTKYNCIRSVRGKGLLIGIEFDDTITAQGMREQLFSMGILVSAIGKSTIRLAPPLIITKAQANQFIKALDKILKNVAGPKSVFGMIKEALPSKKQIKDSASGVNKAKIDRLDEAGLTDKRDIDIIEEDDD